MIQAHFSSIEKYILVNLQKATKEIKVAVAWITNPRLFDALLAQRQAGKSVEIIIADDRMNFTNPHVNFQNFIDLGGTVRISRYPRLMHHKFCILDNRILLTGSYNWTQNAERLNLENIIISTELELIKQFLQCFEALVAKTERVNTVATIPLHDYTTEQEKQREFEFLISTDQETGADTNANESLSIAAKIVPSDISTEVVEMYEKAELYYLAGKYAPALELAQMILGQRDDIAQVYELIATIKWRENKFREQVEYATKAIELDNQFYDAYNTLGIGYAGLKNAQRSIINFQICLDKDPEDYIVLKNRASAYIDLELDDNVPVKLRNQFKNKADEDLRKAIFLTDKYEREEENKFMLYFVRGTAKFMLGKLLTAKTDLTKAQEIYKALPKGSQDIHYLREINQTLNEIKRGRN